MATRRKKIEATGTRAVIYRRVSSAQQVESGLGLDDQQARLEAYCALRGLEVVQVVTDPGESAGKPMARRPGGSTVLDLVQRRKVDAVVVLKLDRAFRSAKDCLTVVDDWNRKGVALHIVDMGGGESVDTQSAMGRMFLTMAAAFAEMERRLIEDRTTSALTQKFRSGSMRSGKDAPYGWRYEGDTLAEVPEEQTVLGLVRQWHGAGWTQRAICRGLTSEGHRNRAGGEFAHGQIQRMLQGSVRQMVGGAR